MNETVPPNAILRLIEENIDETTLDPHTRRWRKLLHPLLQRVTMEYDRSHPDQLPGHLRHHLRSVLTTGVRLALPIARHGRNMSTREYYQPALSGLDTRITRETGVHLTYEELGVLLDYASTLPLDGKDPGVALPE